jgi:hypothetical protein
MDARTVIGLGGREGLSEGTRGIDTRQAVPRLTQEGMASWAMAFVLHYGCRLLNVHVSSLTSTVDMSSAHLTRLRRWLLSSPPAEWGVQQVRELLIGALRQGPIPGHVAFVMDGNRRYARTHHIETVEGHHLGFEALARVCSCLRYLHN